MLVHEFLCPLLVCFYVFLVKDLNESQSIPLNYICIARNHRNSLKGLNRPNMYGWVSMEGILRRNKEFGIPISRDDQEYNWCHN